MEKYRKDGNKKDMMKIQGSVHLEYDDFFLFISYVYNYVAINTFFTS